MSTRPDPAPGRDPPLIPVPRWDDRDEQRHQKVGSRGGKPRTNTTTSDTTNDDEEDDVTVIAFSMTPTVPLPTFIARELAILIVRTIRRRGADNPLTYKYRGWSRMLEAAAYVPHWELSDGTRTKRTPGSSWVQASHAHASPRCEGVEPHSAGRPARIVRTNRGRHPKALQPFSSDMHCLLQERNLESLSTKSNYG